MSARHLQGKKIFIDGDRGIGDMLVLTPAFRTLKEICPSCELTVGAYELPALQALERLPYIDHVRKMEDSGLGSKIRTAWQLVHIGADYKESEDMLCKPFKRARKNNSARAGLKS